MKRKAYGMALILALIVSMLAACSGGNNEPKPSESGPPEATGNATNENAGEDNAASKLEPYEILWYTIGPEQPKDTELIEQKANEYLKDKINATIKFKVLDWGSFDTRFNAMAASNEKFDLVFTASWRNYNSNAAKGAFLPVDELLAEYAPNTKALFTEEFLNGAKINGKLYAVPVNKDKAQSQGFLYRKDLADKHGIDMSGIQSFEDMEAVLQTIKEKEPNLIPFGAQKGYIGKPGLVNITEPLGGVYSMLSDQKDDNTVYNGYESQGFLDSLKLLHRWYKAGYTRQDVATYTGGGAEDFVKGLAFSYADQLKPGKDKEVEAGLKSVVATAEVAQIELTPPTTGFGDITGAMLAVSKTSENPERAMMFLELLNTDKYLNNLFNFGIEDVHYKKVSDNVIEPIESNKWPFVGANWIMANQYINYLLPNEDPEKWTKFEAFNNSATIEKGVGFQFNQESVKMEASQIQNVITEFGNTLWWGVLDPETTVPKFLDKLEKAGVDAFIAELQKQYDAWRAETGGQ